MQVAVMYLNSYHVHKASYPGFVTIIKEKMQLSDNVQLTQYVSIAFIVLPLSPCLILFIIFQIYFCLVPLQNALHYFKPRKLTLSIFL